MTRGALDGDDLEARSGDGHHRAAGNGETTRTQQQTPATLSPHPRGLSHPRGKRPKGWVTKPPLSVGSEPLRTRPRHAGEAYEALRLADRLLSELDACLRSGEEPPEPWRR
ncbi:hypothetical protein GCM10028793_14200 [Nocardiopsis oceani]